MTLSRTIVAVAVLTAGAIPLSAQAGAACMGPGAAFGITAYQCASCAFKRDSLGRQVYAFNAEPVILETILGSQFSAGDIVVAVGGQPITTAEAANAFAYPLESPLLVAGPLIIVDGVAIPPSVHRMSIRVRRGSTSMTFMHRVSDRCGNGGVPFSVPRDTARIRIRGWATPPLNDRYRIMTDSLRARLNLSGDTLVLQRRLEVIRDSVKHLVATRAEPTQTTSRYGFALGCRPSCSKARARDGTEFWKYDGYPPIVEIRPSSAAEAAGLKIGDQVTEVDGLSILSEEGALRVLGTITLDSFRLTILRDGKKIDYTLAWKVRKPPPQ